MAGRFRRGGALANTTVDGRVVAIPYEMGVTPVMYNKRLLQEAGWDRFPETFDELWECAEDLKAAGITPFSQMTGENAWTTMLWYSQVVVAIGGPDVYDNPEHPPAFVEAARVIKKNVRLHNFRRGRCRCRRFGRPFPSGKNSHFHEWPMVHWQIANGWFKQYV